MRKESYTRKDLEKLAARYKLELVLDPRETYELYAPAGYQFTDTGVHMRIEPHRGDPRWKKEAINDLVEFLLRYEKQHIPVLTKCKRGCDCGWDD